MTGKEIKILLLQNDITQAQIARALGISISAVHQVIFREAKSRRVERYIAKLLKKRVEELFQKAA